MLNHVEIGNRTHQSEEEVEVGLGLCDEDDDIHDLFGRRASACQLTSSNSGARVLQPMPSLLTQTTAPTEQVSMTVMIRRSITWSTDANPELATSSEQRIDGHVRRTLVTSLALAKVVEQEETA